MSLRTDGTPGLFGSELRKVRPVDNRSSIGWVPVLMDSIVVGGDDRDLSLLSGLLSAQVYYCSASRRYSGHSRSVWCWVVEHHYCWVIGML